MPIFINHTTRDSRVSLPRNKSGGLVNPLQAQAGFDDPRIQYVPKIDVNSLAEPRWQVVGSLVVFSIIAIFYLISFFNSLAK